MQTNFPSKPERLNNTKNKNIGSQKSRQTHAAMFLFTALMVHLNHWLVQTCQVDWSPNPSGRIWPPFFASQSGMVIEHWWQILGFNKSVCLHSTLHAWHTSFSPTPADVGWFLWSKNKMMRCRQNLLFAEIIISKLVSPLSFCRVWQSKVLILLFAWFVQSGIWHEHFKTIIMNANYEHPSYIYITESSAVRPPVSHVLFFFCFFGFLQEFFVFGFWLTMASVRWKQMHNTTLMRLFTKPYIRWEKSAQLPIKPQQPKQPREKKQKNIEKTKKTQKNKKNKKT